MEQKIGDYMIDASVLLKYKADKHLNVFWQYDGKPWLENNITKALINTFESLECDSKKDFIQSFFGIDLSDRVTFRYYLQTSPDKEDIESVDEDKRLLFAFSPTGKSWGTEGIDSGDIDLIKKSIEVSIRQNYPLKDEKEIEDLVHRQVKETKEIIKNRGDSIPDAWILISVNDQLKYCIALENKLYDLDPFQLHNHCEKSLLMQQNRIRYAKYSEILEKLNVLKGYLIGDFLRYMYFLDYWNVDNLIQLQGMDEEHLKGYARERCRQLLVEVSRKEVSWHRGWMYRYKTDNDYNREVGMDYYSNLRIFRMPLYFGSTQSSSRSMYKMLGETGYRINKKFNYCNSFHFQFMGTGKNVSESYYSCESFDIEKYIQFWIDNSDSIWQMDKVKRAELLENMLLGEIISKAEYDRLLNFSVGYDKPLNVCPEFGVYCDWTFEQAQSLDEKGMFAEDICNCISEVYGQLNIKE